MSTPTMSCHRCQQPMPLAQTKFEDGIRVLTCPACHCEHRWLLGQSVIDLRDGADSLDISDAANPESDVSTDTSEER